MNNALYGWINNGMLAHMANGCGWRMLNVGEWISACNWHTGVAAILHDMICMVFIPF